MKSRATPAKSTRTPIRPPSVASAHEVAAARPCCPGSAGEDRDDQVVRDREQPPLDEHEPARELLGIVDLQPRRVVGAVGEREGRILVGSEGAVGVEADAPRPAEHADVEVEDAAGVAAGEEDREAGDDGRDREADPEEEEDDEVRDGEQPLEEPQAAAYLGSSSPVRRSGKAGAGWSCGAPSWCSDGR